MAGCLPGDTHHNKGFIEVRGCDVVSLSLRDAAKLRIPHQVGHVPARHLQAERLSRGGPLKLNVTLLLPFPGIQRCLNHNATSMLWGKGDALALCRDCPVFGLSWSPLVGTT